VPDRTARFAPRRSERWTPAEDAVLSESPPGTSHRELAIRLGRTGAGVIERIRTLGVRRGEATR
jgi:hypothetical protein